MLNMNIVSGTIYFISLIFKIKKNQTIMELKAMWTQI
jgi:hypothetical protein